MRRALAKALQVLLLLPATVSVRILVPAISDGLADPNRGEGLLDASLAAACLAGLAASWIVIFSAASWVRRKPVLKRILQSGLALGILGGCSILISEVSSVLRSEDSEPSSPILIWTLYLGTPLAVLLYQFFLLQRRRAAPGAP